jgi:four helix bundle protein
MSQLQHARAFTDLVVYQKARLVATRIFQITRGFPKEESYSLTDQARRASRSVGAQIAEAWGKRRYGRHFVSKLTDADAEQLETQHWVGVARDCGYLTEEQFCILNDELREIGRMLSSMMEKADSFCDQCSHEVRDSDADYFTGHP